MQPLNIFPKIEENSCSPKPTYSGLNLNGTPNCKAKKFNTISNIDLLDLVTKGEVHKSRLSMRVDAKKFKGLEFKTEAGPRGGRRCKTLNSKPQDPTPAFAIDDLRGTGSVVLGPDLKIETRKTMRISER